MRREPSLQTNDKPSASLTVTNSRGTTMFEKLPKEIQETIKKLLENNDFQAAKRLYDVWQCKIGKAVPSF